MNKPDVRAAIMSDSHGDREAVKRALDRMGPINAVFHLGDGGGETSLLHSKDPLYAVRGNCDFTSDKPLDGMVVLGGVRIYFCHGHGLRVKSGLEMLAEHAQQLGAQIALFGHTHLRCAKYRNGVLLLNPGCLSRGRALQESGFAVLEIRSGEIRHSFIDI